MVNQDLPYYLANAAWFFDESHLEALHDWYTAKELPPAIITEPKPLYSAFQLDLGFGLREACRVNLSCQVEQVNWTQMQAFSDCLAKYYQQPTFAFSLAKHLASVLQTQKKMLAFMSYEETPTGAMFVYETEYALIAMLAADPSKSLEARLVLEAEQQGKQALIFETEQDKDYLVRLERWVIV